MRNREEAKNRFFEIVDQVRERNKDIDPQEAKASINETVEFVKQEELKEIKHL